MGKRKSREVLVPSHLAGWLGLVTSKGDAPYIEAAVRCPCGNERLEFHYPGVTHLPYGRDEPTPCTMEIPLQGGESRFYFGIRMVCGVCQAERMVFDSDLHGWYAATSGPEYAAEQAALSRPRLFVWRCLACGSAAHTGRVGFSLDSRDDFLDRVEGRVDAEQWPDAFHWFDMTIACGGCGHETKPWVSYECR